MNLLDLAYPYQRQFIENPKKRKIWLSSRQIGKSWTDAFIASRKALEKKNNLVLTISTGQKSANELLCKCKQFADSVKVLSNGKIDYTASAECLKFSTGGRILSLPSGNPNSLRGYSSVCTIIDEMGFVENAEEVMQAIGPSLTRDENAELIITSTPAGRNGLFWDMYQDSLANEDWYVQTTTIDDAIRDGLKIDLGKLKSLCPDPDVFNQEYRCVFSSECGQMIDVGLLDWYDEIDGTVIATYFSADIGRIHDRTCIVVSKETKDCLFVDDVITLNKTEYQKQLDIFGELNSKYHFNAGFVDQGGIGSAVAEFATKRISSKIKGYSFTASNKTPAYENLRSKIFEHKVKFNSKYRKLIENDFRNCQRLVSESGKVVYRAGRNELGHSDFVSSLVLNLEAAKGNPISFSFPVQHMRNSAFGRILRRI